MIDRIGIPISNDVLRRIGFDKNFEEFLKRGFNQARIEGERLRKTYPMTAKAEFIGFYISSYLHPVTFQLECHIRPVIQTIDGYYAIKQSQHRTNSWSLDENEVKQFVIKKEDIKL